MANPTDPVPIRPLRRALRGVVLALAGSLVLSGLIFVGNCRSSFCERAMIAIGLPGALLLSAIAQALVVIGLWLLWTAAHRRGD